MDGDVLPTVDESVDGDVPPIADVHLHAPGFKRHDLHTIMRASPLDPLCKVGFSLECEIVRRRYENAGEALVAVVVCGRVVWRWLSLGLGLGLRGLTHILCQEGRGGT